MDSLAKEIGQMLLVGFHGLKPGDPWPERLRGQIAEGKVGGVLLFKYNIESPAQAAALNSSLKAAARDLPLLVAVDQEGGRVQRLDSGNGFLDHRSAKDVAATMTPDEAFSHYRSMAAMTAAAGFNLVFGPVADLDGPEPSPVIGGKQRSYGPRPETVAEYGGAFVDAMRAEGMISCLKHFPGHGRAKGDTHAGLVDVTGTWSDEELEPFRLLMAGGKADMVMSAHIVHREFDRERPATLSPAVLQGVLRDRLGFDGVLSTDDLHMGAIQQNYGLEEALISAAAAGVDLLLLGNNPTGAQGVPGFKPDPELPEKAAGILMKAVRDGRLPEARIREAFERISRLKRERLKA